jgi:hypothetical protein
MVLSKVNSSVEPEKEAEIKVEEDKKKTDDID